MTLANNRQIATNKYDVVLDAIHHRGLLDVCVCVHSIAGLERVCRMF